MANWFNSANEGVEVRAELPVMGSPYQPISATNLEGTNAGAVSADRAIGLAGVYRAVTVLGTAVSQLDLGVYRNDQEVPQASTSLIARPDYTQPLTAFLEATVTSLATNGNAYWLLNKKSPTDTVQNITVLNPLMIHIEDRDGKRFYNYGDKRYQEWQVKHLKLTRLPGYTYGVGPIQACQNELRGALDLRNYADNWFREGERTKVILKTDKALNQQQADDYTQRWIDSRGDVRTLGSGLSAERWAITPAEAQWLESQSFSITQIARMFGLPAQYLMTDPGNSSTYSNQQDVDSNFLKFTLSRYLNEIEDAFSDLLPRGQEVRFKVESLLRTDVPDIATRNAALKTAVDAGIMTVDEARAEMGLPPLTANTSEGPTTESDE